MRSGKRNRPKDESGQKRITDRPEQREILLMVDQRVGDRGARENTIGFHGMDADSVWVDRDDVHERFEERETKAFWHSGFAEAVNRIDAIGSACGGPGILRNPW